MLRILVNLPRINTNGLKVMISGNSCNSWQPITTNTHKGENNKLHQSVNKITQINKLRQANMAKIIAGINMTLDAFCEHTAVNPDEAVHQHYTEFLKSAGVILYGRITYQLMESYWPKLVKTPSGDPSMDEFAAAINSIPKIVFSRSLKQVEWETAKLATRDLETEVLALKQQAGKDILVGSRSLIISLLNLNLIDEFQLCVHPVIVGNGLLPLFKNISGRIELLAPSQATGYHHMLFEAVWQTESFGGVLSHAQGGAARRSSTAVNALRLYFAGGNITSGTVRVYGVQA